MKNRKAVWRTIAVVAMLALCLSLPRLFPIAAQASAADEPYSSSEADTSLGVQGEVGADLVPSENFMPGQQPLEPGGAGSTAESDGVDESGPPPESNDEKLDGFEEEKPESNLKSESEPESEPEPEIEGPLAMETDGLLLSSLSVPGYNVFEVDSYAALAEALRSTNYPSEVYPETSVYIMLTESVDIEADFTLHTSIDKIIIDGNGQHTLSENKLFRTYVSANTLEVTFKDLTIVGNQYFGLFSNIHGTDVTYRYERVTYTGPQLLYAPNSTAYFDACDIHIIGAGNVAGEVAEIRDVYIDGRTSIQHNSTLSVFYLYNGGNLVLREGATLEVNALGENPYILFPALAPSALRLEDNANLLIGGKSSQLAGGIGIHSIYLGNNATFNWEAHRAGGDYVVVNASDGVKDAIYLSPGAEFRIAPAGTVSERLIWISSGNVIVGEGAKFCLQANGYTTPTAPFALDGGGALSVGKSATLLMQVKNSTPITYGLVTFRGTGGSFTIGKDATTVMHVNRAASAIYFLGGNSSMEIIDPNYLEIATTNGNPYYFSTATPTNTSTLTYTDVQQLNYWYDGISKAFTYLEGGAPIQRWVAQTGGISIKATISGNGNGGLTTQLTNGQLDTVWPSALNNVNFRWGSARILSAGKIGIEVSSEGFDYTGQITTPNMDIPYSQGKVQVIAGPPGKDWPVSHPSPATPDFYVRQIQAVGPNVEVSVWAEYGYIFHNNPPAITGGTLSLSVPAVMEFGTLAVPFADVDVTAQSAYALDVQDGRSVRGPWQVLASFDGFADTGKSLESTLVVNGVPLQATPQQIITSTGSENVPLDAILRVPGGAVEAGAYTGNITWTLVDAP